MIQALGSDSVQIPPEGLKILAQKLAVSYQGVSTTDKDTTRQKRALDKWLASHPEYRLLDTEVQKFSG
jgi:hypothetical protein